MTMFAVFGPVVDAESYNPFQRAADGVRLMAGLPEVLHSQPAVMVRPGNREPLPRRDTAAVSHPRTRQPMLLRSRLGNEVDGSKHLDDTLSSF